MSRDDYFRFTSHRHKSKSNIMTVLAARELIASGQIKVKNHL